jgi:hypothetical protein
VLPKPMADSPSMEALIRQAGCSADECCAVQPASARDKKEVHHGQRGCLRLTGSAAKRRFQRRSSALLWTPRSDDPFGACPQILVFGHPDWG